jgi:hypothetical protein
MMLTNENWALHMQQWNYIKIKQAKKNNNMMSVTNSHRLSWTTKNNTKFNKI